MTTRATLTRRALIAMAAIAALLAGRPGLASGQSGWTQPSRPGAGRLIRIFKHKHSARAVGRAYLRQAPGEADPLLLMNAISDADPCIREALDHGEAAVLDAALRNRIRRDFADGRTVCVEGWLLSQTEARLCAIAELA